MATLFSEPCGLFFGRRWPEYTKVLCLRELHRLTHKSRRPLAVQNTTAELAVVQHQWQVFHVGSNFVNHPRSVQLCSAEERKQLRNPVRSRNLFRRKAQWPAEAGHAQSSQRGRMDQKWMSADGWSYIPATLTKAKLVQVAASCPKKRALDVSSGSRADDFQATQSALILQARTFILST